MIARRRRRREADLDKERIAYLEATIPDLAATVDAATVVNLVPRPSPVVDELLRQRRPVVLPDLAPSSSIAATVPIDGS